MGDFGAIVGNSAGPDMNSEHKIQSRNILQRKDEMMAWINTCFLSIS